MTRPPSRAYRTTVRAIRPLTPHLTRVTLGDAELARFGTGGLDQRIKLVLPRADGTMPEIGLFDEPRPQLAEWYRRWRELPDEERNPIRTYTVRRIRAQAAEIDVDFVLHGVEGPASAWALGARVGDELVVVGPDGRASTSGGGIEWHPGGARSVLLAGDETAAPAICAILESLDEGFSGEALVEMPEEADALPVATRSAVTVRWLARGGRPHGEALVEAVREWGLRVGAAARATTAPEPVAEDAILWEVPEDGPAGERYAWLAGEAGVITALRRHLVRDLGVDRRAVAFMGYWRRGRAEGS